MKRLLSLFFGLMIASFIHAQLTWLGLAKETLKYYSEDEKIALQKELFEYNEQCKPIKITTQFWNREENLYKDQYLETIEYLLNNLEFRRTRQIWDNIDDSGWINGTRSTTTYNPDQLPAEVIEEYWVSSLSEWKSNGRITYTYNQDKLLQQELREFYLGSWIALEKTTYAYNPDQTLHQSTLELFDFFSGWKLWERSTNSYTTNAKVGTKLVEMWGNNQWDKNKLFNYEYDSEDNMVYQLEQNYDVATSGWINYSEWLNTYDANNNTLTVALSRRWDNGTMLWYNDYETLYTYGLCSVLPVSFTGFTATSSGKHIQLDWVTAAEVNSRDFAVQRSTDGRNFATIGTVLAKGNSSIRQLYHFTDATALQTGVQKLFYRLQLNDKDGKYTYSGIEQVNLQPEQVSRFVISPNPVQDMLSLDLGSFNGQCTIRITDQIGRLLLSRHYNHLQQGSTYQISTETLKAGLYYLQVISGDRVQTIKFLKH